ncbi:phage stabilization protein [Caudoviricetes sp.]|nr:phage stabilization protein [Caudoviricetes sp.]
MPDFGFVGPSYEAPSIYQDAQECINFYPEIDPLKAPGSRGVVALYPTPGLTQQLQLNNAPVRGMRALSGGNILIAVVGNTVYSINTSLVSTSVGTLSTSTGVVTITDNIVTTSGLIVYIVDGPNRYTLDVSTNTFTTLPNTDGAWQGATVCDTVDNYIIYNQPNTQNWGATDLSSALSTNAYFGSKDGSPDNLITLIADHRQVYLLGEVTTEVWVDVGNTISGIITFPFQRIQGTSMQHGCAAPYSVARFAEQFMFVSKDTRGQVTIGMIQGYQYQRLSTHAVEQSLVNQVVSDAIAYTYRIEGHEFYVVTFPTADITWVYDLASQMWHKWLSVDTNNVFHRHRSNCYAFFNGMNLVGDYQNGKIYSLDNNVYTDNGSVIRRVRRAPHLISDLQRQYFDELQIQFQPGVGLSGTQQGTDPQAMLRWSNDGGSTWSNEHWVSIGKIGRYKNRAIWRRLGWSRDKIFEVVVTDPVKAVIVSANLKASVGDN